MIVDVCELGWVGLWFGGWMCWFGWMGCLLVCFVCVGIIVQVMY